MKLSKAILAETIIEPYGVRLQIVFTHELAGVAEHLGVTNAEEVEGRAGFAVEIDDTQVLAFDRQGLNYGTVAHESLHCVYNIMRHVGQPLEGGEEACAYLLQHIFDCCVTAATKKRVKISPL